MPIEEYNKLPLTNEKNLEHTAKVFRWVEMIRTRIVYPGGFSKMPIPQSKEEVVALSGLDKKRSPFYEVEGVRKIVTFKIKDLGKMGMKLKPA